MRICRLPSQLLSFFFVMLRMSSAVSGGIILEKRRKVCDALRRKKKNKKMEPKKVSGDEICNGIYPFAEVKIGSLCWTWQSLVLNAF